MVRVAAFPSAARVLLPRVWSGLGRDPGLRLDLRLTEREPDKAVEALRSRTADIAVVHAYSLLPRPLPPGCEQHHLMDDPVLLALPAGLAERQRLAPGDAADLAGFSGEDWLMPGPETSCHELTVRACGAAGFVPRPVALAEDFSVLIALVSVAAGVALVPRMALPAGTSGVSLHPLTRRVTRTVSAFAGTGEARRPQLRRVLDLLRDAAEEAGPRP